MGETKQGELTVVVPLSASEALQVIGLLDLAEADVPTHVGVADMFWGRVKRAIWGPGKTPCGESRSGEGAGRGGCGDVPVSAGNYEWNAEPSGRVYGGGAEDA